MYQWLSLAVEKYRGFLNWPTFSTVLLCFKCNQQILWSWCITAKCMFFYIKAQEIKHDHHVLQLIYFFSPFLICLATLPWHFSDNSAKITQKTKRRLIKNRQTANIMIYWHKIIPSLSFVKILLKSQHLPWKYQVRLFYKIHNFICRSSQRKYLESAPDRLVSAAFLEQNLYHWTELATDTNYRSQKPICLPPLSPTTSEIISRAVSAFFAIDHTWRKRVLSG